MLLAARRRLRALAIGVAPLWLRYLYPTPKLDVRAVVFRGAGLLLVRDAADRRWSLPGGWIDLGESLAESAVREVREESGYDVVATKLLAVSNIRRRRDGRPMKVNVFRMFVRCDLVSDTASSIEGAETTEAAFFGEDDLPELSTGRGTHEDLRRMFVHLREPDRPCEFA